MWESCTRPDPKAHTDKVRRFKVFDVKYILVEKLAAGEGRWTPAGGCSLSVCREICSWDRVTGDGWKKADVFSAQEKYCDQTGTRKNNNLH